MTTSPNNIAVKEREPVAIDAWDTLENMLSRQYMDIVPQLEAIAPLEGFDEVLKTVRADKITRILYDRSEDNLTKFRNVFTAMHASGSTAFVCLHSNGKTTEIYLGVRGRNCATADISMSTFERALSGNFPGINFQHQDKKGRIELSQKLINGKYLSCVTGVPSLKSEDDEKFVQGIEKIVDAMGTTPYTALFLATPVDMQSLDEAEKAYQNIYTCLSLNNVNQLSLSHQESLSYGENISSSISQTISENITLTDTYTLSKNKTQSVSEAVSNTSNDSITDTSSITNSTTSTDTKTHTDNRSHTESSSHSTTTSKTKSTSLGVSFILSANKSWSKTKSTTDTIGRSDTIGESDAVSHGETVGSAKGFSKGKTHGSGHGETTTVGKTEGEVVTDGKSAGKTTGDAKTTGETIGKSTSLSLADTKTYNVAVTDKGITEALNSIDEQLKRIKSAKNYGAWNWAGYFVAEEREIVKSAADIYTGLLAGEQTGLERAKIMLWSHDDAAGLKVAKQSLARFEHPVFAKNGYEFSLSSLISTPEVAVSMSLPQKSLPYLPVFDSTQFGRAIVTYNNPKENQRLCHIGYISHLNTITPHDVSLDFDSLCGHTFVTGSTGSGKSKAVNQILYGLVENNTKDPKVHFLVIEPAKGEYKDIWGGKRGCNGCKVFGTNPQFTELLKINPFSFPNNIHVIEHIDRLIEILNAVWPMYAAMPAILKDAIEQTYVNCGWDLLSSKNCHTPAVFPDFNDLINILPQIISNSDYSAETKGDYSGALVTRVKSLTNTYFRFLFQKDETSSKELFDQNTIIDLSRVGSSETKSLLMGLIFLKLQEYRIATATNADQNLKHVTILEEAHHLLRRTNMAQDQESSNLQGKAVEMLTNAIAEMRTYGEGFIIADQAPGLLDPSVIRNTNTKIVFRLPDFDDRELVGKAQNLNDDQIMELARLRTGCASVYQNDWQEAVLCQFDLFDPDKLYGVKGRKQFEVPKNVIMDDSREKAENKLLICVLEAFAGKEIIEISPEEKWQLSLYFPDFQEILNAEKEQLLITLSQLFVAKIVNSVPTTNNFHVWEKQLFDLLSKDPHVIHLPHELRPVLRKAVYLILADSDNNPKQQTIWLERAKDVKEAK